MDIRYRPRAQGSDIDIRKTSVDTDEAAYDYEIVTGSLMTEGHTNYTCNIDFSYSARLSRSLAIPNHRDDYIRSLLPSIKNDALKLETQRYSNLYVNIFYC